MEEAPQTERPPLPQPSTHVEVYLARGCALLEEVNERLAALTRLEPFAKRQRR